jgi:LacI family transcriptional regulator
MTTIRDIAHRAGVSPATVSRVLNYDSGLSVADNTKKQIFEAAEQLNYTKYKMKTRPKQVAIRFVQWNDEQEELADLYYLSIRLGIEKKVNELGLHLEKESLKEVSESRAAACIALGKFDAHQLKKLKAQNDELLLVDFDGLSQKINSVVVDFRQSVDLVVDHFIRKGHEKWLMLSGEEYTKETKQPVEDPRLVAFRERVNELKRLETTDFITAAFSVEAGERAMRQYLKKAKPLPSAVFASSDALAIGAMRAIQAAGYSIPNDISVVGFNDVSVAKYVSPALTTVRVDTEWLGELAVDTMADLLKNPAPVARKITIATELIERQSS